MALEREMSLSLRTFVFIPICDLDMNYLPPASNCVCVLETLSCSRSVFRGLGRTVVTVRISVCSQGARLESRENAEALVCENLKFSNHLDAVCGQLLEMCI